MTMIKFNEIDKNYQIHYASNEELKNEIMDYCLKNKLYYLVDGYESVVFIFAHAPHDIIINERVKIKHLKADKFLSKILKINK